MWRGGEKGGIGGLGMGLNNGAVDPEHRTGAGRRLKFSHKGPPLKVRGLSFSLLNHYTCIKYRIHVFYLPFA